MRPTLAVGDYIWVSRFAYGIPLFSRETASPARGDIVVYKRGNGTHFVRRIVGLPGDRLQYRRGRLYINDVPAGRTPAGTDGELTLYAETLPGSYQYSIAEKSDTGPGDNTPLYVVPDGYYFGLGDNRDNSYDSRFKNIGYIPRDSIVGRFSVVYWNSRTRQLMWETLP
jgi:signal peptidase I